MNTERTIRSYYYLMVTTSALPLITVSSAVAALPQQRLQHLPYAIASLAAVMGVLNVIGARWLFAPIAHYLRGSNNVEPARTRIMRLPWLSAGWVFALLLVYAMPLFFFKSVLCDGCDAGRIVSIGDMLLAGGLYAVFVGAFGYFLISSYVLWLKQTLFERSGTILAPAHGRLSYKLLLAFLSTSVVPMLLFFLDTTVLVDMRTVQGVNNLLDWQIDSIVIALFIVTVFVFFQRSLTRPVETLLKAASRVSHGDLDVVAPVVSNDEIGVLTARFNDMVRGLKDRDFIRQTFSRFVPESVVAAVLQDRGVIRPQVRDATILFTDIAGFSTICERLEPEQIITMLNEYFDAMANPIRQCGGVITQFQGDAILASFNLPVADPDHAMHAVQAAVEIQRLSEERRFANGIKLMTRIGISTGRVVGGTVGDADRVGYTVHGDEVNLAARLEQLNKEYGTRVLVSEQTKARTGDRFSFRHLGEITVRGRETPVRIYELTAD